jgi:hypothetical protein
MTMPLKTKINTTFVSLDGTSGTRSKMDDFRSVRARIFARLQASDEASAAEHFLMSGVSAYNHGDYEGALSHLLRSTAQIPAFEGELRPHIHVCTRVIHSVLSPRDIEYREARSEWEQLPFYVKWFRRAPAL